MTDIKKPILCVGLICLDIVVECKEYPLENTDKRCVSHVWRRGGNASNTCTVLKELRYSCECMGTLATDLGSRFLKNDLENYDINIDNCLFLDNYESPTTTAIINQQNGSRTLLHSNKNLPELSFEDFKKLHLFNYSWIHFEGRNVQEIKAMVKHVNNYNESHPKPAQTIGLSIELEKNKVRLKELLECNVDTFIIGREFGEMVGGNSKEETLTIVSKMCKLKCQIVCPWGEEGAVALDNDRKNIIVGKPFIPTKLVDTLGAGDSFIAGLLISLSHGSSLEYAVNHGCLVAGLKCGMNGFNGLGNVYRSISFASCGEANT